LLISHFTAVDNTDDNHYTDMAATLADTKDTLNTAVTAKYDSIESEIHADGDDSRALMLADHDDLTDSLISNISYNRDGLDSE